MLLSSFIMSLISLREIAVPASNIVCKKSIYKINLSLFVGFIMLDVSFFVLAQWYLFRYDGKQVSVPKTLLASCKSQVLMYTQS